MRSQLDILQLENQALKEENKNIVILEIEQMERLSNSNKKTIGVQIEDIERMFCIECEYPAEDVFDLGEHMYEVHAELNDDYTISCYYCGNYCKTKGDLMVHRKKAHPEKFNLCRYFAAGHCDFDNECWFNHSDTTSPSVKTLTNFKCTLCEKVFHSRSDFMTHRKKEHHESIPLCKGAGNGMCHFGSSKCWYNHIEE